MNLLKTLTLCSASLFISSILYGQTGVGINLDNSNPDASAMLDIKASNQGLLIPRVALNSTADVATMIFSSNKFTRL